MSSSLKDSLQENVIEASAAIEDAVNLDGPFSGESVDDSPRRLEDFTPCSIRDPAQLGWCAAAVRQNRKRVCTRNNPIEELFGARARLVYQVCCQSFDIARGDVRPGDGEVPGAHALAAFSRAVFPRRRISSVE